MFLGWVTRPGRINRCNLQEGFVPVRGLQVSLKTKEKDDKVLLICNLPTSTQETWDATRNAHKGAFYD